MTFEGMLANAKDLDRIQRLADAGHFAPWFPQYSRKAAIRYLANVAALKMVYTVLPYPGPTVTE